MYSKIRNMCPECGREDDDLLQQMEMVQMLQVQFMSMSRQDLFGVMCAMYEYLPKNKHGNRARKIIDEYPTRSITDGGYDCLAVTLALHLSGVEE